MDKKTLEKKVRFFGILAGLLTGTPLPPITKVPIEMYLFQEPHFNVFGGLMKSEYVWLRHHRFIGRFNSIILAGIVSAHV